MGAGDKGHPRGGHIGAKTRLNHPCKDLGARCQGRGNSKHEGPMVETCLFQEQKEDQPVEAQEASKEWYKQGPEMQARLHGALESQVRSFDFILIVMRSPWNQWLTDIGPCAGSIKRT